MKSALAQHHTILRHSIAANNGVVFETAGDSFVAVFTSAPDALRAALHAQRALHSAHWEEPVGRLKVRMGLHSGSAEMHLDGYYAQHTLSRLARLLACAYGDQIVLSLATQELVRDSLPSEVELRDLGEHHLKDLIRPEHIYQLVAAGAPWGLPSEFPLLKTLDARANNLPRQAASLVGREKELVAVVAVLRKREVALVTLTGPGGTGKTRLSLQAAAEVLDDDDFSNGVWFVELATVVEAHLLIPTIAQALGLQEAGGTPIIDILKEYLKDKHLLLVLDNFEQVVGAGKEVSALIAACPDLKVLVTSRIPLHIRGEKEYQVPPLSVPDVRQWHNLDRLPPLERLTQYEAVRLFIERATDVKADFEVTNDNAPAVAEICVRLDGLPLAIELAAARTKLFSPQALLTRLSSSLSSSSRLKLLTGGAKDLPARQQTLRGAIEWSYDLLEEGEKQLFRRMAPFSGGRTLEALEGVCNYDGQLLMDVMDGAQSLVDKSLLQQREGRDGEPRFWMLETIHEYAREKLAESEEGETLHREHALYFMKLAEEAEPRLGGKGQAEWLNKLEEEYDNLRAALRWAREERDAGEGGKAGEGEQDGVIKAREVGLRTAGAIWRFWLMRGYYSEGREELEALLSPDPAPGPSMSTMSMMSAPPVISGNGTSSDPSNSNTHLTHLTHLSAAAGRSARVKALVGAGTLAWRQGDLPAARIAAEKALDLAQELEDKQSMANSLHFSSLIASELRDYAKAHSKLEQSLALYRELGDRGGVSIALSNLGYLARVHGDYPAARSLLEESLAILTELGEKSRRAWLLNNLGYIADNEGDYPTAHSHYEQSLALSRELGDRNGIAMALRNLGSVARVEGDYHTARSLLEESLAIFRELGEKKSIAMALINLGYVAYSEEDYPPARSLYEQSLALFREVRDKAGIAWSLQCLGNVAHSEGDYPVARSLFEESLIIHRELGAKAAVAENLAALGAVAIAAAVGVHAAEHSTDRTEERGEVGDVAQSEYRERGPMLLGAAGGLLASIGAVLDPEDRSRYEQSVATARSMLGEEAFEEAMQEGRAMSMEEAIEYALGRTPER
jgi:predicted ATPase/uncharacterized protein HemY